MILSLEVDYVLSNAIGGLSTAFPDPPSCKDLKGGCDLFNFFPKTITCKGSDWQYLDNHVTGKHTDAWDIYMQGCRFMAYSLMIHYVSLFYVGVRFMDWSRFKWNSDPVDVKADPESLTTALLGNSLKDDDTKTMEKEPLKKNSTASVSEFRQSLL